MKTRIEALEKAYEEHRYYAEDLPMNRTLQAACMTSLEAGNDYPDFSEVIWEEDIEQILKDCKTYGISEFTISSNFSGLIKTIAAFEDLGAKMEGITRVNSRYADWSTGKHEIIPAIRMSI